MSLWTGLILLALGAVVWFYGDRLWLLGAGAGALLGAGLLRLFPGMADGFMGLFVVAGLAILLGVLGFWGKAFMKIIAWGVGFVAGGGIALGLLDAMGLSLGFWDWILALIAGGIGALIFARFLDWALIIFASLVGALLLVRGASMLLPSLVGTLDAVLFLALAALGVYYHYRKRAPSAS